MPFNPPVLGPKMREALIPICGGAGAVGRSQTTPEARRKYEDALRQALDGIGAILASGGLVEDGVTEAVRLLKEYPLISADHGSVFTSGGAHELDAATMDGRDLASGAVAGLTTLHDPVVAAHAVMERSG